MDLIKRSDAIKEREMDLIKRSDAIKAIDDLPHCYNGWSDAYDKAYIILTLEEVPKADRPQGEWIDIGGYEVCRNCHEVKRFPHWNFCPNCGAHMKGADDDFCSYGERGDE